MISCSWTVAVTCLPAHLLAQLWNKTLTETHNIWKAFSFLATECCLSSDHPACLAARSLAQLCSFSSSWLNWCLLADKVSNYRLSSQPIVRQQNGNGSCPSYFCCWSTNARIYIYGCALFIRAHKQHCTRVIPEKVPLTTDGNTSSKSRTPNSNVWLNFAPENPNSNAEILSYEAWNCIFCYPIMSHDSWNSKCTNYITHHWNKEIAPSHTF